MKCQSCGRPTFGPRCAECAGERRLPPVADDATGFHVAPARYSGQERETIDLLRDAAGALLREALAAGCSPGDAAFAVHCGLTARKYRSRLGRKGPPEEDLRKAEWYEQMWEHVVRGGPDPRSYRAGFSPYVRPESP